MPDKPILFSGPMVRAILDGRKSQTRRVLKRQPHERAKGCYHRPDGSWVWVDAHRENNGVGYYGNRIDDRHFYAPYAIGDRLWVREAWRTHSIADLVKPSKLPHYGPLEYVADGSLSGDETDHGGYVSGKLRPGIFMPRWASRLTLVVADVEVERVQDISNGEAIDEGVQPNGKGATPIDQFRALWDSLNKGRGFGWDVNPWVVAITFETHRKNIDQMEAA